MHYHTTPEIPRPRQWRSLLILALAAVPAWAQTPSSTADVSNEPVVKLDEFRVTAGFAGSLAAAAEAKALAPTITEVIAAEDIGKLPDISIADALTRLTGLTTQRINGRSQGVTVRGLTGDFSTGLLNGREQVSTSMNRSVEYDQFPAELLESVAVYKTAQPSLTNQGLSATIDQRTVRPLSKSRRTIALGAYYEWTAFKQLTPGISDKGERFNLSYVDQLAGGTVGVALGYSHSARPFQGQQFQAWGYPTDAQGNYGLGGTKSYVRTSHLDRDSFMAVIEFKPNEHIHSMVDIFTSKFEEKQLLRGLEIPLIWSGAQVQPGTVIKNGYAETMKLTNVQPVVRNDVFHRDDDPISIGWNVKINEKSDFPINFDVGYSKVARTDMNLETYSGLGFRGTAATTDTMTVKLLPGQIPVITSTVDYTSGTALKLTDPQGWGPDTLPGGGMYGYMKQFRAKDELGQVQLSGLWKLHQGILRDVEAGGSYTQRYKRDGEGPSGWLNTPRGQVTLPLPTSIGTTDMSFLGLGRVYAYDPLSEWGRGTWGFTANPDTGIAANRFETEEKLTQLFLQLNMERRSGAVPITGNVGVRAIHSDQSSKGYSANGNSLNYVRGGDKYWDFAPSLNLNFELSKHDVLRFSLARQVARPRMYDLRASRSWGYDPTRAGSGDLSQGPWSGSGGNPLLRPWRSDSADLSLEHYFRDNLGYISLAGFYKKLKSYIYTESSVADFSSYPVPGGTTSPVLRKGIVSQAVNGTGGNIQGAEFTLSLPSEVISRSLKGFGVVLNAAYTDSSIRPWGPNNAAAPIAGFARRVANATVYYERSGFSARISERYRSATREYITTFGPPNPGGDVSPNSGFTIAEPEQVVDAQVSYSFNRGPAKNLTVYFQVYNLTNEPLVTYQNGDPRQVMNYQKYGASYSLGASYRF